MPTTFLVQRPFFTARVSDIQCDTGNQIAPCPPSAPFASFAPCDCVQSCYGGKKEGTSYLLRSCETCVALGGNWMAGDDLISSACIGYAYTPSGPNCNNDDTDGCVQEASRGFPYCSSFAGSSLLLNYVGTTPQVYTTPWQCAHGTSFCSSIRIGASPCVAMIFFLSLIPLALINMCLARVFPAEAPNPAPDCSFLCMVRFSHSLSQLGSFIPATVAEFCISYFWAPLVLLYYPFQLIFSLILALCKWFDMIFCDAHEGPAGDATEPPQQQPPGADACVVVETGCDQSLGGQSAGETGCDQSLGGQSATGCDQSLGGQSVAHRLQELDRMLSEGLVTAEEHKRRRSAILECMEPLELEQVAPQLK